ncbi:Sarcosine oxidase subunit beta [Hyphomicrobiales bacterium]|nr:Sarcosine oxidase subunit beta [Hyphomicrobiales bacterium]CAH1692730.1 Sarcosine oxidase subunit beta [Hyphomicrobiales bacterium]
MSDVIVIGSGVIGTSIAYHLAREGAKVTLVDKAFDAATKPAATWASAGGLRSQGRHAEDQPITRLAAQRWKTLSEELDAELEASFGGHLHIAETEAEIPVIEQRLAADTAAGLPIERVEGSRLRGIAPALTENAIIGAYTAGDGQAHPGRTARAFACAAERLGAKLIFGQAATIRMEGGIATGATLADGSILSGGQVVLATGAWSIELLSKLGILLPLRWRGLQMLLSDIAEKMLAPTVTAVGRNLSLKQTPSGEFMIGGRWIAAPVASGFGSTCVDAHVARQWSSAAAILPALRSRRLAQAWSGIEAQSIDSLPFIGRTRIGGLNLATGFSNHGFQISPQIGACVASDILNGHEPLLAPFEPHRHDGIDPAKVAAFIAEPIAC